MTQLAEVKQVIEKLGTDLIAALRAFPAAMAQRAAQGAGGGPSPAGGEQERAERRAEREEIRAERKAEREEIRAERKAEREERKQEMEREKAEKEREKEEKEREREEEKRRKKEQQDRQKKWEAAPATIADYAKSMTWAPQKYHGQIAQVPNLLGSIFRGNPAAFAQSALAMAGAFYIKPPRPDQSDGALGAGTAASALAQAAGGVGAAAGGSAAANLAAAGGVGAAAGAGGGTSALAGAGAALLANPVGAFVAATAAVAGLAVGIPVLGHAMAKLPLAITNWVGSLVDAQRALAEFSPAMAAVMARSDFKKIQRERDEGNRLAGTTEMLANAWNDLMEATKELRIAFGHLWNYLGVAIAKAVEWVMNLNPVKALKSGALGVGGWLAGKALEGGFLDKSIKDILGELNKIAENTAPKIQNIGMGEWLERVARDVDRREARADRPVFVPPGGGF